MTSSNDLFWSLFLLITVSVTTWSWPYNVRFEKSCGLNSNSHCMSHLFTIESQSSWLLCTTTWVLTPYVGKRPVGSVYLAICLDPAPRRACLLATMLTRQKFNLWIKKKRRRSTWMRRWLGRCGQCGLSILHREADVGELLFLLLLS